MIEASFIDTWAATAAGGLTLTENSLYTMEAWKLFLNRLSPSGILSFSRWYWSGFPAETYRLVSLAASALRSEGVSDPRGHIVLISNAWPDIISGGRGAATILVGKESFSADDLDKLESLSRQMRFNLVLSPRGAQDSVFSALGNGDQNTSAVRSLPLNLSPPTDDRPFFFHIKPLRYAFRDTTPNQSGTFVLEVQSGEIVIVLLVLVVFLTSMFVIVPLFHGMGKESIPASIPYLLFFAAIGMGFMLVEVSQMQRLIIFLGHPTYALSVVLSALLVFSGMGSYSTRQIQRPGRDGAVRLLLLLLALLAFGLFSIPAIAAFAASTTPVRIAMAIAMLFPAGFFMGMAFPLGLKLATGELDSLMPAFWGMNGAASICASILAMLIAMNAGISAAFWSGFCCYVAAFCAYLWALYGQGSSQRTQILAYGSASSTFMA